MLALISPAKTLDYETALPTDVHTLPRLLTHSQQLIDSSRQLSATQIADLMKVSEKIAQLKVFRDARGLDFDIEIDGGVNNETISAAYEAGANVFVAGSYVYDKVDPAAKIAILKELTK